MLENPEDKENERKSGSNNRGIGVPNGSKPSGSPGPGIDGRGTGGTGLSGSVSSSSEQRSAERGSGADGSGGGEGDAGERGSVGRDLRAVKVNPAEFRGGDGRAINFASAGGSAGSSSPERSEGTGGDGGAGERGDVGRGATIRHPRGHAPDCDCQRCAEWRVSKGVAVGQTPESVDFGTLFGAPSGKTPSMAASLAMVWDGVFNTICLIGYGDHWKLSVDESKRLGIATEGVVQSIPTAKKKKLLRQMGKYLPWLTFTTAVGMITYPRILATQLVINEQRARMTGKVLNYADHKSEPIQQRRSDSEPAAAVDNPNSTVNPVHESPNTIFLADSETNEQPD